ncbi:polysaccharide biosynthesis protein [Bacillus sp. CECT 9360]|uniref:putative polysaccharide biosynthesis protein n=1 Tax=Bacillus sp. CECT 9360 TaxID=2845821 RepID=UPI001E33900C|nr:polysaccharide biosynthesis protein [Bacillus sp. CECT 9360]CAH0347585.1 Lipid II flippase MurJ [Bacillus sp. CECT 9360]
MAEKPEHLSKKLFEGALLLTFAAIFIKVLSAAYRIPYQNITGDIGFYIYQQVYPFYGIAVAFSTFGFPMIISKLIAERHSSRLTIKEIMFTSFVILSLVGLLLFGGLYFGAVFIAGQMRDPELADLIRIIAFSFLLMPFISVVRGYYQGFHNMLPTAASQIFEQVVRISTILVFSFVLIQQGYSLYVVGAGAAFGSIAGGVTAVLVLVSFVWLRKDWKKVQQSRVRAKTFPAITKILLWQGLSFCIASLILVFIQLVDSMNLYMLLRKGGLGEIAAKEWKGVYDRGQPLIQLGTVVSNSIALSLVPLLSGFVQQKRRSEMIPIIKMALLISLTIGAAAGVGLFCIIEPANYMLFTDNQGSAELAVLSVSIIFTSVIMAEASILQSLGHNLETILIVVTGIVVKWLLNLVLVPHSLIMGASYATVISFFVMSLLFFAVLKKHLKQSLFDRQQLLILLQATILMGVLVWGFNHVFEDEVSNRILAAFQALGGVLLGGCIFVAVILRKGMFTRRELEMLPVGTKLVKFLYR